MSIHREPCSTSDISQARAVPNDCTPEQLAQDRYLAAIDALVADAVEGKRMPVLANVLAWTTARIAVGCGAAATGDLLRRIGGYMCQLETERQAENEALLAKREGRQPN